MSFTCVMMFSKSGCPALLSVFFQSELRQWFCSFSFLACKIHFISLFYKLNDLGFLDLLSELRNFEQIKTILCLVKK